MSNLVIADLAQRQELAAPDLAAVRGGLGDVNLNLDILHNLNIGVSQAIISPISVLNGSVIAAPTSVGITNLPTQAAGIGLGVLPLA